MSRSRTHHPSLTRTQRTWTSSKHMTISCREARVHSLDAMGMDTGATTPQVSVVWVRKLDCLRPLGMTTRARKLLELSARMAEMDQ